VYHYDRRGRGESGDTAPYAKEREVEDLAALIEHAGGPVELFLTEAAGVPAESVSGMRQAPFWPDFEAVAPTVRYDALFMDGTLTGGPLPRERWAGVTVPVLVIDGGASADYMHNAANAAADLLPDAGRRTIEGQQHVVDPSLLAPVLREFFTN
jgi:pimeloyl-ACP methyl ester carboxylesterase